MGKTYTLTREEWVDLRDAVGDAVNNVAYLLEALDTMYIPQFRKKKRAFSGDFLCAYFGHM